MTIEAAILTFKPGDVVLVESGQRVSAIQQNGESWMAHTIWTKRGAKHPGVLTFMHAENIGMREMERINADEATHLAVH